MIVVKLTADSALGTDFRGDVIGSMDNEFLYGKFPGVLIRTGYSYAANLKSTHIVAVMPKDEIFTLSRDRFHKDVRFYAFDGEKVIIKKR